MFRIISNQKQKKAALNLKLLYNSNNSVGTRFITINKGQLLDENNRTFIRIGDTISQLKNVTNKSSISKIPIGYLTSPSSPSNSINEKILKESNSYLSHLRWLMQKDSLGQDCFLIGSPPGAFRRRLAMSYAEMMKRPVEYLCITRDTTESDMKQRREITNSTVKYINQCAVNAAINGQILLIEGIEKAERNLLPVLNNLLENREMNLDDGHFLVAPQRYDKLVELAKHEQEVVIIIKI
jgi:hypothetical protein